MNVGPPGDQAGQRDLPPRRHDASDQRRDDAKSLGCVVECEADDERGCDGGRAGCRRSADREPLTEVVRPDADRDDQRESTSGFSACDGGRA